MLPSRTASFQDDTTMCWSQKQDFSLYLCFCPVNPSVNMVQEALSFPLFSLKLCRTGLCLGPVLRVPEFPFIIFNVTGTWYWVPYKKCSVAEPVKKKKRQK